MANPNPKEITIAVQIHRKRVYIWSTWPVRVYLFSNMYRFYRLWLLVLCDQQLYYLYIKYHSKYLAVLRSNHQITLSTRSYYLCFHQFSLILHLISPWVNLDFINFHFDFQLLFDKYLLNNGFLVGNTTSCFILALTVTHIASYKSVAIDNRHDSIGTIQVSTKEKPASPVIVCHKLIFSPTIQQVVRFNK